MTLLNVAAVSHLTQPAYYEFDTTPVMQSPYYLQYVSNSLKSYNNDTGNSCQTSKSSLIATKEATRTPINKKPKLNFSIEAIMGFK